MKTTLLRDLNDAMKVGRDPFAALSEGPGERRPHGDGDGDADAAAAPEALRPSAEGASDARLVSLRDALELVAAEREQMAADLHDDLSQWLAATGFLSSALARDLADAGSPHAAAAQSIAANLQASLRRVHLISRGLAPPEIGEVDLPGVLRALAEWVTAASPLACRYVGIDELPGLEEFAVVHLYRLTQEAVRNAFRHSGGRTIEVDLCAADGALRLAIADDGSGLDPSNRRGGLGLRTMRYRASLLGATLTIGPRADGGTVVRCELPWRPSGVELTAR